MATFRRSSTTPEALHLLRRCACVFVCGRKQTAAWGTSATSSDSDTLSRDAVATSNASKFLGPFTPWCRCALKLTSLRVFAFFFKIAVHSGTPVFPPSPCCQSAVVDSVFFWHAVSCMLTHLSASHLTIRSVGPVSGQPCGVSKLIPKRTPRISMCVSLAKQQPIPANHAVRPPKLQRLENDCCSCPNYATASMDIRAS